MLKSTIGGITAMILGGAAAMLSMLALASCAKVSPDYICIRGDYADVVMAERRETATGSVRYYFKDGNEIEQSIGPENSSEWHCDPAGAEEVKGV